MDISTTEKIKKRIPDLAFIPGTPVDKHPAFTKLKLEFNPEHILLPKGHQKADGKRKLNVDTILERDNAVTMRDGIKLYLDVFRPKSSDQDKVPAIIAWSPYGKAGSAWTLDLFVHRMGIPVDRTSGYESWEAPDPADWCQRGYAVVNVDARGSGWSEGTLFSWGSQEAEDIHDTVAYLSQQPWCNGSVTMAGNSYLAKAQIVAASRNPHPALKAIAPWEGFTDTYNDMFLRGGFPSHQTFANMFLHAYAGTGEVENIPAMVKLHPLYDDYWEDKADKVENIDIPIYALGSFSNPFHTRGSFHIFRKAKSDKKWLRIMPNFEWYDLYQRESNNDLQRFYDRYCKGIMNGWEHDTPPLRLSLIGCEGSVPNITERHEKEFPLQRQQLKTFFLDGATKTLVDTPLKNQATVAHEAHSLDASSDFILKFNEYTELAGYAKVRLWMSCQEHDDMDVCVQIRKIDKHGNPLVSLNCPLPVPDSEVPDNCHSKLFGPQGFLRASHSISYDEELSSADGQEIFYRHDREEKIVPGTVVPLQITFWPMGLVFAAGEGIMLRISGHNKNGFLFDMAKLTKPEDANIGQHKVYTGGNQDSQLILPIVSGNRT